MGGTSTHPDRPELRDEIGQLIAWSQRTGRNSHFVAADILALPRVARALARDTAGPDWQAIAALLYKAIGELEDATPGGFGHWYNGRIPSVQPAINAYEFADDAVRSVGVSHD